MAEYAWVPVADDAAYALAVRERSENGTSVYKTLDGDVHVEAPASACYAVADPAAARLVVADMVQMHEVNRASILHVLRARYAADAIYTAMGSVLVATNPFRHIEAVYAPAALARYVDKAVSDEDLAPHVWMTARRAYRALVTHGASQSLIVSGESGAGKTETTKKALELVAAAAAAAEGARGGARRPTRRASFKPAGGSTAEKVLSASPILEAFGNAKTLRNDNSSRFGKYLEVVLDAAGKVVGAKTTNYLLEKSRVVAQAAGERSYHALYLTRSASTLTSIRTQR